MENTRLAWLAGIIDGEGVIGFYDVKNINKKRCATYQYHVRVINSDPDIITECDAIVTELTGHRSCHGRDLRKDRNHIYWYVSINHQVDIVKVLTAVIPYMIGKKTQAQLLLDLLKHHVKYQRYTKVERDVIGILNEKREDDADIRERRTKPIN